MTTVMSPHCEVETVEDVDSLRGLRCEWDEAVLANGAEPWLTFSWVEAAATAYSKNHLLRVMTVRQWGKLSAIAPLVLKPSEQTLHPLRIDFLGGEELKEPNGFVAPDPTSLDILVSGIVSEPRYPVRLSRVPNDRDVMSALIAKFKKAGWITRAMRMPYPYLNLEGYTVRKSLNEDLRRARRKAARHGELKLEVAAPRRGEELQQQLQLAFRIEASGWKGRNGTAILCNRSRREFFERYAQSAQDDGTFRLFFLKVGDRPVAVQYGIESRGAYWLLNIGYDEEYRECSPGNLLLSETVESAARSGLTRYNFLGKEEPWIRRWTEDVRDCLVLAAYRPNSYGFRAILSDALYMMQKKKKRQQAELSKVQRGAGR